MLTITARKHMRARARVRGQRSAVSGQWSVVSGQLLANGTSSSLPIS
ncbi:hypothetical protein [Moorena producens]|nr:hypothetical protein [Moorena producens]